MVELQPSVEVEAIYPQLQSQELLKLTFAKFIQMLMEFIQLTRELNQKLKN